MENFKTRKYRVMMPHISTILLQQSTTITCWLILFYPYFNPVLTAHPSPDFEANPRHQYHLMHKYFSTYLQKVRTLSTITAITNYTLKSNN